MRSNPNAFLLLTLIALRARYSATGYNAYGLEVGQALIGDHKSAGLSEQNYRTAKRHLEKTGLATFKPTNRGTIATLSNSVIYDLYLGRGNEQNNDLANRLETDGQRPTNGQVTTNNNGKRDNIENKGHNGKKIIAGRDFSRDAIDRFIELWNMTFLREIGRPYTWTTADMKQAGFIIRESGQTPERLIGLASESWFNTNEFLRLQSLTVRGFANQLNALEANDSLEKSLPR